MLATEKRAAAPTATPKPDIPDELYGYCQDKASKILEEAARILLRLQTPLTRGEQRACWHIFESKLRQYVSLGRCGGQG